jgi:hypothetical protein
VQTSVRVHATPSSQRVLSGFVTSEGHRADDPVQLSPMSHGPAAARQTVVAPANASAGQAADIPVHFSSASHASTAGRQTVVLGKSGLAGQVADIPVQNAAVSHLSAADRHCVVEGANVLWVQLPVPLHWSTVHGLLSVVHAVFKGLDEHVPTDPAKLHATHAVVSPLLQPVLQQTPSLQKPLAH